MLFNRMDKYASVLAEMKQHTTNISLESLCFVGAAPLRVRMGRKEKGPKHDPRIEPDLLSPV